MNKPPKRLLDQVREQIRLKHYSIRTEQAYVSWIKNYSPPSRKDRRVFVFFCFSLTPKDRLRYLRDGGHEKQNDSTLRVIKCPYWHLATRELMHFVVSAA